MNRFGEFGGNEGSRRDGASAQPRDPAHRRFRCVDGIRKAKPRMPTLLPTSDPHSSLAMGNNATALPHVDAVDLAQKIERLTDGQFVSPSYQRAYVLREAPL
jgi:hypothetical protein